jgi:hypothetical protein
MTAYGALECGDTTPLSMMPIFPANPRVHNKYVDSNVWLLIITP